MAKVAVLGGGVSGLATAYYLNKLSNIKKVVLLEATNYLGGWIKSTKHEDGTIYENGARSIRCLGEPGKNIINLVDDLQLASQVLAIGKEHSLTLKRMIIVNGKLQTLPSAFSLIKSSPPFKPLISYLWKDLFQKSKFCVDDNLYEFANRRFGREVADYLLDPLCRGIYAGDCRKLSVKTFAKSMFEGEQNNKSAVMGMLKAASESKSKPGLPLSQLAQLAKNGYWQMFNFQNGLQQLIDTLKNRIENDGVELHLSSPVTKLNFSNKNSKVFVKDEFFADCDYVFSALPAHNLCSVLDEKLTPIKDLLNETKSVTVAAVVLEFEGLPEEVLSKKGFGFLVPSHEPIKILGIIFDSYIFPQHDAGKSRTRLTVMMGGDWFTSWFGDPEQVSSSELYDTAVNAVEQYLKVKQPIVRSHVFLHKNCIPQYTVGHFERLKDLRKLILDFNLPLSLIGASFDGVGIADCVYNARSQVELFNENPLNVGLLNA